MSEVHDKKVPVPAGAWKNPVQLIALGFGPGLMPKAPGTWGTLTGVLLFYFMADLPLLYYVLITVALFIVGVWICDVTAKAWGVHDHSAIVWDEVVGYLITMIAMPKHWLWIVVGFALFRLFDIWKPWPIRWCDRQLQGGFGIMVDDVLAGVYAAVLLQACYFGYMAL